MHWSVHDVTVENLSIGKLPVAKSIKQNKCYSTKSKPIGTERELLI